MAATDTDHITTLLTQLDSAKTAYQSSKPGARETLIEACQQTAAALYNPSETLIRLTWAEPSHHAIIRLGGEIKLFEALVTNNGSPKSSADIAGLCEPKGEVEALLVRRMLRHLAAMGTVREVDVDVWAPTPFANTMCEEHYRDTVVFLNDHYDLTHLKAPEYWRKHGFKSPTVGNDTPYQHAIDTEKLGLFPYLQSHPPQMKYFGNMMRAWSEGQVPWFDYYPIQEQLIQGAKPDSAFLVDVGGNQGYDLMGLLAKFGDKLPGKCVLQDQAPVIEAAKTTLPQTGSIEAMPHDFNTPQPIRGARAYMIKQVLEDWSDDGCIHIIKQITQSMQSGYSKLLLCEWILPDKAAHWSTTCLDWELMSVMAARHHTEAEFRMFAERAGLVVKGIWRGPGGVGDGVLELELA